MEENLQYSSQSIRQIRSEAEDLLHRMKQRTERILYLTEEILSGQDLAQQGNNGLTDQWPALSAALQQMIENYEDQMQHLETAADLYDGCSKAVLKEAEAALAKGGAGK